MFGYSWKRCLDGREGIEEGRTKKVVQRESEELGNGHGNGQASSMDRRTSEGEEANRVKVAGSKSKTRVRGGKKRPTTTTATSYELGPRYYLRSQSNRQADGNETRI